LVRPPQLLERQITPSLSKNKTFIQQIYEEKLNIQNQEFSTPSISFLS
jgi:hypothetical protein